MLHCYTNSAATCNFFLQNTTQRCCQFQPFPIYLRELHGRRPMLEKAVILNSGLFEHCKYFWVNQYVESLSLLETSASKINIVPSLFLLHPQALLCFSHFLWMNRLPPSLTGADQTTPIGACPAPASIEWVVS